MKQLIIKALNIWLPMSVFLAPIAFWEIIFKDIFNFRDDPMRSIFEFFGSCTIISAYILFPLFFIYQIVLKLKKKLSNASFIMSLITFLIMILSITFYIILFRGLEEGKAKAHRESERIEIQNRKK